MKGLIGGLIIIFGLILTASGVFLLISRPTGVALNCNGQITGIGSPEYPLTSFESQCRAEVEVTKDNETLCRGSGRIKNDESIITCKGLDEHKDETLNISATFYNESGQYAETSGSFYNGR